MNSHLDETADEFGAFIDGTGPPETHLDNFMTNMYALLLLKGEVNSYVSSETRPTEDTTHEDHPIPQFVLSNDNAIADASEESVSIAIIIVS